MGCISRLLVAAALAVQIIAAALGMLVLGSAGVLSEAALISSTDAVVFVMLALSLAATFVLAIKLWFNSRNRKRLERALASATVTVQTPHPSALPR
ncbi:MAG: hypothetical protein M3457_05950 [Chloroflexota bacterium]|nr:hypothetical protein [Chloroflexota bacterium]